MKKLFLTSGLVLCMAGQASASTDIGYSNNTYDASACTYPYLDTYESSSSLEAKWDANISGQITLNSNRFASSSASTAATTANTAAALTPVYSKYGTGIYSSAANATAETNAITALSTMPVMTGYNFQGFYTEKAGTGTPVINSSGNYLDAAKTQVATSGGTATWYAHWTAKNDIAVSYAAGTASNPNNPNSATHTPTGSTASQTATYDSSLTLAANGFTAPNGYTFNKWESPKVLTTGASTTTQYSAGTSINPWKVADNITLTATWTPINYTITYQDTTSDTNGTALYGSLTGSVPSQQTVSYDNTANLTSMTGTRTGYTFAGWTGNHNIQAVDGTGASNYSDGLSVTYLYPGNVTLTANWDPNKSGAITLVDDVFPDNSVTEAPTPATTHVTTATIYSIYNTGLYKDTILTPMVASEEIPTATGYTFNGFYDSSMATQYITDAGVATVAGTRAVTTASGTDTWYAKWTPNVYTITLRDYNNQTTHSTIYEKYATGWYSDSTATTAIANNKITPPTRSGYTFRGFYTAQQSDLTATGGSGTRRITNTGVLPANTTFSANTNLYAAWAQNCNAGTGCNCSLTINDNGTATYTTSAQTGYTLTSGSGTYAPVCTPDSHTITYSCGTKPGSESQTGTVPTPGTATYNATFNIAANTCVYNGWHFNGWSCDYNIETGASGTTSYAAGASGTSTVQHDVTCTATWVANTINLTWSANGGTAQGGGTYAPGTGTDSCTYDGSITLPAVPEKNGYTFTGWSVTSTSSN